MPLKITVHVQPKETVLDPQGSAVQHAMHTLGFEKAGETRVGKTITFVLDEADTPQLRARIDTLCADLLSNPVIEDYRYEVAAA